MVDDRFVTVAVCYSLPAAAVARSALEAQGLRVQPVGAAFATVNWHFIIAVGGVELRVPEADAGFARELLSEGEPIPLRESAAFRAAWVRNVVTFIALYLACGLWMPFWTRRQAFVAPAAQVQAPSI